MENITPEELKNKLESLPAQVKGAIKFTGVNQKILDLSKSYELHIDEAEELKIHTLLLLCGIATPDKFVENISGAIGMSKEDAAAIAADINESILLPIRKYLVEKANANSEPQITKESILSEIENPTPTIKPFTPNNIINPIGQSRTPNQTPTTPIRNTPPATNPNIFNTPRPSSPATPAPKPQGTSTFSTSPRPPFQTPNNPNPPAQKPYMGQQTQDNKPKIYPTDPYREQSK